MIYDLKTFGSLTRLFHLFVEIRVPTFCDLFRTVAKTAFAVAQRLTEIVISTIQSVFTTHRTIMMQKLSKEHCSVCCAATALWRKSNVLDQVFEAFLIARVLDQL